MESLRADREAGPSTAQAPERTVILGEACPVGADWTGAILANFEDPIVSDKAELLGNSAGKRELTAFTQSRVLSEEISPACVQALREVLTVLERVMATDTGLRNTLTKGGMPCAIDELNSRFNAHVERMAEGTDPSRIRVVGE